MSDLIQLLSNPQPVVFARPEQSVKALQEAIGRKYVHILFKETETELGISLTEKECQLDAADFDQATGKVTLIGAMQLNYQKVKCRVELDLANCEGVGSLEKIDEEAYAALLS